MALADFWGPVDIKSSEGVNGVLAWSFSQSL